MNYVPEVIKIVVLLNAGCTCKAGHYPGGMPDRSTHGRQHTALLVRPWVVTLTASTTCRHRQLQGIPTRHEVDHEEQLAIHLEPVPQGVCCLVGQAQVAKDKGADDDIKVALQTVHISWSALGSACLGSCKAAVLASPLMLPPHT